jgi:SAM-dependent methyltransferase
VHPADALDVGCGTGKAARLLAARGVAVLGVELDAKMAEIARGHGVPVEIASFESWDDRGRRFDLLVSGQAWHWIDPAIGVGKAARVLRPGGTIALFWNVSRLDERTQHALDEVYRALAPNLLRPAADPKSPTEPPYAGDLRAAPEFADVQTREYAWQHSYSRDEWLRLIQTQSDHLLLAPDRRAELVDAVGAAIDGLGGTVDTPYVTNTILARRLG